MALYRSCPVVSKIWSRRSFPQTENARALCMVETDGRRDVRIKILSEEQIQKCGLADLSVS